MFERNRDSYLKQVFGQQNGDLRSVANFALGFADKVQCLPLEAEYWPLMTNPSESVEIRKAALQPRETETL